MLEEVEVPQPLGLGVMDRMHTFDARCREPAPGDEVDADRQDLSSRVEINAPDIPGFGNAERRFKQLVLHAQAVASKTECSTMPHSAWLDCTVLRAPSRVRFAGLRPPLTAPAGRSSLDPTHSDFKRGTIPARRQASATSPSHRTERQKSVQPPHNLYIQLASLVQSRSSS